MTHELCKTAFIDDDIAEYKDLISTHRDYVDDLKFLDQPAFDTPLLDSFTRFSMDSVTAMRLSEIEEKRDALKRQRQFEISQAETKISRIESNISALKLLKMHYETFFEHKLMPAAESKLESEGEVIADLANLRLKLADKSEEYEPIFSDFDLPEELDQEFRSICSGYSKVSYRGNWEKLM